VSAGPKAIFWQNSNIEIRIFDQKNRDFRLITNWTRMDR
jgi:hypothetical protein